MDFDYRGETGFEADDIEDIYELTPMQQGMLFHTLFAPETTAFIYASRCT